MIDLLVAGGWVMPLIVACSVVALSISIERYIALDRSKVAPPHLLATVWRDLKQGELNAQKLAQLRTNSPHRRWLHVLERHTVSRRRGKFTCNYH